MMTCDVLPVVMFSFSQQFFQRLNIIISRCYSGTDGENSAEKDCLRADKDEKKTSASASRRFGQQISLSSVFIVFYILYPGFVFFWKIYYKEYWHHSQAFCF